VESSIRLGWTDNLAQRGVKRVYVLLWPAGRESSGLLG
jgi:hypothetical protein